MTKNTNIMSIFKARKYKVNLRLILARLFKNRHKYTLNALKDRVEAYLAHIPLLPIECGVETCG